MLHEEKMNVENANKTNMHAVVFPWLAFGHLLPFLTLAKHLASNGHRVSFVSPPRNLDRLRSKIPSQLSPLLSLVPLPLPHHPNLPPEAQATIDVPPDKVPYIMEAYDGLQEPLARFLEASSEPPVGWIIYDFNTWIAPIADRLGIKKAFFSIIGVWSLSVVAPLPIPTVDVNLLESTFPHKYQALLDAKKRMKSHNDVAPQTGVTLKGCDVILIRSSSEFELESIQLLEMLYGKTVVPVGLLPPTIPEGGTPEEDETWKTISGWLDNQAKGSVVYVALGTEASPSQEELTELALGLEESQKTFFWVMRKPKGSSLELPEGFEERTKDRGLIWRSWAPQPRILGHNSVGAFVTHCGWSSILEGIYFESPLILLPFFLDQLTSANDMEERKIGIKIPRENEDGPFTCDAVAESIQVLLHHERGQVYRDEVKKLRKLVFDEVLHRQYFDTLEEYLREHIPQRM